MADNTQIEVKKTNSFLAPFKYIYLGLKAIILGFFKFCMYTCLGAYYMILYIILKPLTLILNTFRDIYYVLFTPKQVKKEKELKLDINDDKDNVKSENVNKKDIYTQMKENQKKAVKAKPQAKVNIKQKVKLDAERDALLKIIAEGQDKRLEKPQTFRYKALNPEGKIITSTFMGVSKLDIYTFLTSEGYTVFSIETSDWINFAYGQSSTLFNQKISTKDLIFFITQLSTYIKSGITLTEAMRILSKQLKKNKNIHRIMQSIVYYLTMGEAFSSCLEHQNGAFPQLMINMIKAAEAAGNLDETLDDLSTYYTEIDTTRKQMISAISYPAFVGLFSIIVIVVIMVMIIPKFVGIYETAGATLNPLTQFIIYLSNFLANYIYVILLIIFVIIFIVYLAYKNVKAFRIAFQVMMMKIPVVGKIIIYNEITVFTKTFASLLKNDVFITETIEILSNLTKNEIYKDIMITTITNIAKGERISESFKNHWAIPDIAYYMIVTGENTGQLSTMMAKVSNYYQEQHKAIVNSLKSLLEPIMIIFLAVTVGGVLIAVILPMFELYGNMGL